MSAGISLAHARRLVARFPRQRILVVGDVMLDRYIRGSVSRISPEAPVPVVAVESESDAPGGAANVARNVCALGGRAALAGVVGQDQPGRRLVAALKSGGVETSGLVSVSGVRTTLKTRIVAERQQVVRVDWERQPRLGSAVQARLCSTIKQMAAEAAGVVIEDYGKGLVTQQVVDAAVEGARAVGAPIGIDPKSNPNLFLAGVTVVTPNRKEAFALAGVPDSTPAANPLDDVPLRRVADILIERWQPEFLMITLGADGMLLARKGGPAVHLPTRAREVFDVSGAGDTVIAATVLALAAGADWIQAAELANCAAGVVVGKLGTAACTAAELLEFLDLLIRSGHAHDRGVAPARIGRRADRAQRGRHER